ncbi:MAG: B12-binding domain-containing radical SAM protein, partial [Candidatus Omnitrophica bacterium]|nr:B12-binding domain-containing radical SAM protein [Candidatus Omnitrophota bacterium]
MSHTLKPAPKVVFYDHAYETFAIQFLTATLEKRGYNVSVYFDCSMDKDYLDQDFFLTEAFSLSPDMVAKKILRMSPDLVGFSLITVFYPKIRPIMESIKRMNPRVTIIAGGPHCILAPKNVLDNPCIDFLFMGDAEVSLPAFLEKFREMPVEEIKKSSTDALPGIWNNLGGRTIERGFGPIIDNLDEVPFPHKDAYYSKNPSLKKIYTATCSRGCIFNCTYCNSPTVRKLYKECGQTYFRVASVKRVIAELEFAKRKYNPRYIMFIDNLFAPNVGWLREFAKEYNEKIGLPFFCETNPNVHTKETIDLLAYAGCKIIQFGFQSANEDVRRKVLNRHETNEKIAELVLYAKEKGIFVCVDHIANLPYEEKSHLDEAVAFYRRIRPNWINLGYLQYYPGADILSLAIASNSIKKEDVEGIYKGEVQHSFRLLKDSKLGRFYRTLPIRLFCAFKLPKEAGDYLIKLADNKFFEGL